MSRTANSLKNIKYSIIGQVFGLLANFITRMIFIRVLSIDYLGVNGLFTNILSILSFAELGIGPAIIYSMYKPLADKNIKLLKGLMDLYKKAYISIGSFILIGGTMLAPFIELVIKDLPEINNLKFIYFLFVINSAISYFFSYKRSFLIADQKKYIDSFYHILYLLIKSVLQIIVLVTTKNYIFYLLIQITITFIENLTISMKVDKMYPYLNNNEKSSITKDSKVEIIKNIRAMIFHKMGSVVVMSTDNLLIAKFVGIAEVGLYSNYLMIIEALKQIFNVIFKSVVASIGNLGATESSKKNEFIFRCIDLFGFWVYGFSSIALISLLNPFIGIWLGKAYLFPIESVLLIVISFYLRGRRESVLIFRDALGLYWYDRHKPIYESIINLVSSILLIKLLGFQGVILGTIISTITTSAWIEPYVLYRHGFKLSLNKYFQRYIIWTFYIVGIGVLNFWLMNLLGDTLSQFFGKIIITAIIPNVIMTLIFWKTDEFQYILKTFKSLIK